MSTPEPNSEAAPKRSAVGRFFSICNQVLRGLRKVVSVVLNLVFLLIIIAVIGRFASREAAPLPDQAPLRIAPTVLTDQRVYGSPLENLFGDPAPAPRTLRELTEAICHAATDPRITSLILEPGEMQGGLSKVQELGEAIDEFRASGKPVIAVADFYTQNQYLLASYADEIALHSLGALEINGYGIYQPYLNEALESLKINLNVFRSGDYKDAIEPFTRNDMSDESREHLSRLLADLWENYRNTLLVNRPVLTSATLDDYTLRRDQLLAEQGGDDSELTLALQLIDFVGSRDQLRDWVEQRTGTDLEETRPIEVARYLREVDRGPAEAPVIGLVVADGTILDGDQPAGAIGGDSLSRLLRQTREDEQVDALVLRVNSPGGSAFASELIRRELELYREQNIPVVVSMGSLAASGGYWISMGADRIVATPGTVTGSIGVFSIVPTFEESLGALGIYSDGIGSTPFSDALLLDRPMSPEMASIFQSRVDRIYRRFLDLVAAEREIPTAALEPLASGRVWSGERALANQLVDQLGTLRDAEQIAAELAGLEEYRVLLIEPPLSFAEQLAIALSEQSAALLAKLPLLRSLLPAAAQPGGLGDLMSLNDPAHLYLLCAACTPIP